MPLPFAKARHSSLSSASILFTPSISNCPPLVGNSRAYSALNSDSRIDFVLHEGERVAGISCGGGGYGSPLERDPIRVKKDVDEGYVTRKRAEDVYGTVFDESGAIDEEATNALRKWRLHSQ